MSASAHLWCRFQKITMLHILCRPWHCLLWWILGGFTTVDSGALERIGYCRWAPIKTFSRVLNISVNLFALDRIPCRCNPTRKCPDTKCLHGHFGTRQSEYLQWRPITLHIMQMPTRESQRTTLKLTQAACIELHLALVATYNHWYLRWAVAVHPAQQLAAEQRWLDALDFKRFMLNAWLCARYKVSYYYY